MSLMKRKERWEKIYRLSLHDPIVQNAFHAYEICPEMAWEDALVVMIEALAEQNQELRKALLDAGMRLSPTMWQPSVP